MADLAILGQPGDRLGYLNVDVGDFDGDRAPDIAVSAILAAGGAGQVYVFHDPLTRRPATTADADVTITGADTGDRLFYARSLGDHDGDGTDDLALGAHGADDPARPAESDHGGIFVFYGPL